MVLDGSSVLGAASVCTSALAPHTTADWTAAVPDLEMTVAEVVAHAAEACLWYAIDLAAGGADLTTVEHRVKPEEEPELLLATMTAYAKVGAATIDATPSGSRGFHPFGQGGCSFCSGSLAWCHRS